MPVTVGETAPEFALSDQFGRLVSSDELRRRTPVALVFFPLAFSRTCSAELCELRDNIAVFDDARVQLAGISVDSKHTLRAWAEAEGFDFPLLADFWPHGAVASAFDAFLPEHGYASRTTVLVDTAGIIRARFATEPGEPRSLAAYREALAAL